jgi:hypothetical protein
VPGIGIGIGDGVGLGASALVPPKRAQKSPIAEISPNFRMQ